jgi:UDP-glucose 4-epimerase
LIPPGEQQRPNSDAGPRAQPLSRAVVTGAGGFIGGALARALAAGGCEVIAVDRNPPARLDAEFHLLDLAAPAVLEPLLDSGTTIFHMAASADVPGSVEDPRYDFMNTLQPLFEVLDSARKAGCRVIFPSTASVYDIGAELPLTERGFPRPASPYAAAKLAGEAYCFAFHKSYGLDVRVARLFSVYGAGMKRLAIHDFVRRIQVNSHRLTIRGDGKQIRDYLHVSDAVAGLILIATRGAAGEDYNLASGVPVTLSDLARRIATLMGHADMDIVPTGSTFPGDTPRWYADVSKINAIGFSPRVDFPDGLRETVDWLIANPHPHDEIR